MAELSLCGPFRLVAADGSRVEVRSRKGAALIAMLATARGGERTRGWLQDRLWGSRDRPQAQASLRNELLQLRRVLEAHDLGVLRISRDVVTLDLDRVHVNGRGEGEFLEGFDIPGEEGFEDWLREQRAAVADRPAEDERASPTPRAFERLPSIAVLPFANRTGEPGHDYLSEGIAADLIEGLSRLRWLPVISPGQSFVPDATETPLDAGRRLGASYVLSGRLHREEGGFRLSAQVNDTQSGQVIWSPRFDLPAPQASGAMDPLLDSLIAVLEIRIDNAEQVRAAARSESELGVRDLIWRGRWHQNRLSNADVSAARQYFEKAIALAPDDPIAVVEYAQYYGYEIWNHRLPEAAKREYRRLAQRAIALDPDNARGHLMLGIAEMWLRNCDLAEASFERSIALNPSLPIAREQLATFYNMTERPEAAIAEIALAMRLSPSDFRLFCMEGEIGLANLLLGNFDVALDHAGRSIGLRPGYWLAHVVRINALWRSGRVDEARAALSELRDVRPRFAPDYIDWVPFNDRKWTAFLREAIEAVL